MRKVLSVLAVALVAGTGWFFWPRISSTVETQFPSVFEKRAELNQPAETIAEEPKAEAAGEAATPATDEAPTQEAPADEAPATESPTVEETPAAESAPTLEKTAIEAPSQVWF